MKRRGAMIVLLVMLSIHIAGCGTPGQDVPLGDEQPFFGLQPPGMVPKPFAPGIINTNADEAVYSFMAGGTVFIISREEPQTDEEGRAVYGNYITELRDGRWTEFRPVELVTGPSDPTVSLEPGDDAIYFGERKGPEGGKESADSDINIWMVRRTEDGFSNARMIGPPISTEVNDIWPSVTADGTIYFFSEREGGVGKDDIYMARLVEGEYRQVESIGEPVNTPEYEIDPFIALDESYLIFGSNGLGGFGGIDLFISFRDEDGSWSEPVNMGDEINTDTHDERPYVTRDGRYLFFSTYKSGNLDVYWVDAAVIEDLRPRAAD